MPSLITHILKLQIIDSRGRFYRHLHKSEQLSIGIGAANDFIVFDDTFPKSHPLLEHKGNVCLLYLHPKMSGTIQFQDSILGFQDLMVQGMLTRKGAFHILIINRGRQGVIQFGDVEITYSFEPFTLAVDKMPVYSWQVAVRRSLRHDLLFKFIFLFFLMFEVIAFVFLSHLDLPPISPPKTDQVPQRFARFILPSSQEAPITTSTTSSSTSTEGNSETAEQTSDQSSAVGEERTVSTAGLLALIGGRGTQGSSGAAVDALLDRGLVKQLDELLGSTTVLQNRSSGIGNNRGQGGENSDAFDIPIVGMTTGIDELIKSEGVRDVEMKKQGSVNIQSPQSFRGSDEARGERSAESVMSIINAQRGRVMYTYNKYLRLDPELRGKVSLDMTIAADGRVTTVEVVETTIQNAEFIRDLLNILKSLRFSTITAGNVTVNIPF
ncbi:MAG: hypothetical protein EHM72_01810, partial [Calditrichaeota bacterium]